jgi:hypothetical protein
MPRKKSTDTDLAVFRGADHDSQAREGLREQEIKSFSRLQYFLGLGPEARLSASHTTNVRRSDTWVVGRSHRFEKSHARTTLVIGAAIILFPRRMHDIHPALQPSF